MNCDKKRKIKLKRCKLDNKGLIEAKKLLRKTNYKKIYKKEKNNIFLKKKIGLREVKTDLYDKYESYNYLCNNI